MEYQATWTEATKNCTVHTPTIHFNGTEKNLPVNYNLTGTAVWVGYYLAATAFHYIGTYNALIIHRNFSGDEDHFYFTLIYLFNINVKSSGKVYLYSNVILHFMITKYPIISFIHYKVLI